MAVSVTGERKLAWSMPQLIDVIEPKLLDLDRVVSDQEVRADQTPPELFFGMSGFGSGVSAVANTSTGTLPTGTVPVLVEGWCIVLTAGSSGSVHFFVRATIGTYVTSGVNIAVGVNTATSNNMVFWAAIGATSGSTAINIYSSLFERVGP